MPQGSRLILIEYLDLPAFSSHYPGIRNGGSGLMFRIVRSASVVRWK